MYSDVCPCQNYMSGYNILLEWLPQAEVRESINIGAISSFLRVHTSNNPTQINSLDITHVMLKWSEWKEEEKKDSVHLYSSIARLTRTD